MKSLRSKLTLVLAFFAAIMIAFGFVFMPKTASASVDTSTGFYIQDGASIRLKEGENGIRWTAHLTKAGYDRITATAETKGGIKEIGISIIPSLAALEKGEEGFGEEAMRIYKAYEGNYANALSKEGAELVFNWAIFYDNLVPGQDGVTEDDVKNAYSMYLEAIPYVEYGNGEIEFGEVFDTSRSMRDVAIAYLASGEYPDKTELLEKYVGMDVTVDPIDYVSNDSFYSNVDEAGTIAIDDAIVSKITSTSKIYYNAKDVTALYADGEVALADVITKVTTDGKANDFLTIFHADGTIQKQYFVGVTLAIDHIDDFRYFTLSKPVTDRIVSPDGEGTFDGYYILTQNIDANDATGMPVAGMAYNHTFANDSGFSVYARKPAQLIEDVKEGGIFYQKGFTGTFDGRGYVISDLIIGGGAKMGYNKTNNPTEYNYYAAVTGAQTKGGLFGVINGGTVKNVSFNNLKLGVNASGVFADAIVNGGTISNVRYNIYNDLNNYAQCNLIAAYIDSSITLEKMVIEFTRYPSMTGDGGGLVNNNDTVSKQALTTVMNDCYYIANFPAEVGPQQNYVWTKADANSDYVQNTSKTWWKYATVDAAYVDGEAQSTGHTKLYKSWAMDTQVDAKDYYSVKTTNSNGILTGPKEFSAENPYTITLIPGLKRFSSLTVLQEKKALNDFTSWDSDIWTVINGSPTFSQARSWTVDPLIDGAALNLVQENLLGEGDVAEITIKNGDVNTVHNLPKVYVTSGSEHISVVGNKIYAISAGTATILVTYNHKSWTATVNVVKKTITYEKDLTLSASEGIFFDANGNVEDVSSFLDGRQYMSITDGKATNITWADGKLLGATNIIKVGTANSPTNLDYAQIQFETEDTIYVINAKIATLAIDSAWDLEYFTVPSGYTTEGDVSTQFVFATDEFNWDGYYVLVKNIDAAAEGYVHDWTGGTGREITLLIDFGGGHILNIAECIDYFANVGNIDVSNVAKKGLMGTFDGQGHTLSNLETGKSGLFGLIHTGHVINTGFFNNQVTGNNGGFLAWGAASGRDQVKNCFVSSAGGVAGKDYSPLISKIASHAWEVGINTIIIDNTTMPTEPATVKTQIGSYDSNAQRFADYGNHNYYGATAGDDWHWASMNAIVVSTKPLMGFIEAGSTEITAFIDSITVDDVQNTGDAAAVLQKWNDYKVRRYTSIETLKTGITNNASLFNVYTNTGWFEIVDGMITWKGANA